MHRTVGVPGYAGSLSAWFRSTPEALVWLYRSSGLVMLGLAAHFEVERYVLDPTFAALCDRLLADSQRWALTSANDPVSRD